MTFTNRLTRRILIPLTALLLLTILTAGCLAKPEGATPGTAISSEWLTSSGESASPPSISQNDTTAAAVPATGAGAATAATTMPASSPSVTAVPASTTGSVASSAGTAAAAASAATIPSTTAATVTVSIPEGYTMAKICQLLEKKGVNSFSKLFSYATTADFSAYTFIPPTAETPNRCFRLEGFLFPDTYTFYTNENPASVWKRFLDNFAASAVEWTIAAGNKGLSLDQAIIIASLIEKEASSSERANVSAVIRNRLAKKMSLDLDTTLTYYQYVITEYASNPTRFRDYYYTYNFRGLPAGAIGNPGRSAIIAAVNPSDITALYFFTSKSGAFVYSDTYEEHQAKYAADQAAGMTSQTSGQS